MVRDWRSLALAALAAAALTLTGVLGVEAQTPAKAPKAAKAAPKEAQKASQPDDDEPEELKPEAQPKRKKQDPVEAQRSIEGALKLIEGGKAEQAVQTLTTTISGGNLPPAIMAKALLHRGMAYRQQRKPAQAISDISSALWLKGGLSPADRTNAEQQRAAAYQEAGLTDKGEPLATPLPSSTGAAQTKERAARPSSNWGAATITSGAEAAASASPSSQSGSGWGNWFGGGSWGSQPTQAQPKQEATSPSSQSGSGWGNWFGGGSWASQTKQTQPEKEVAPFATTLNATPDSKSSTSSWSSGTEVRSAASQTQRIETASIASARPEGRFSLQVAMVRSQDEAQAVAAKVKRDYAGVLASREPEVDWTVVGNMGTFYRVKVGPFATQNEGQAACARLKGGGFDCMVVTQ